MYVCVIYLNILYLFQSQGVKNLVSFIQIFFIHIYVLIPFFRYYNHIIDASFTKLFDLSIMEKLFTFL